MAHQTIDYVLEFPQAPVEREIFMQIPWGLEVEGGNTKDFVLQLHRNVYGQKQAGRVLNKFLTDILVNKVMSVYSMAVTLSTSCMQMTQYSRDPTKMKSKKQSKTSKLQDLTSLLQEISRISRGSVSEHFNSVGCRILSSLNN
jgi:hypothetical protein